MFIVFLGWSSLLCACGAAVLAIDYNRFFDAGSEGVRAAELEGVQPRWAPWAIACLHTGDPTLNQPLALPCLQLSNP